MKKSNLSTCEIVTWAVAAIGALIVFFLAKAAVGWLIALIVALAFGWFLHLALDQLFCTSSEELSAGHHPKSQELPTSAGEAAAEASAAAKAAPVTTAASMGAASSASAAAPQPTSHADAPRSAEASAQTAATETAPAATPASAKATTTSAEVGAPKKAPAAKKSATKGKTAASKTASGKAGAGKAGAGKAGTGKAASSKTSSKAASNKDAIPDYDGDGVLEGTSEGKRPETLSSARDGKADDLKQIKGIGPKLEKLCNKLGFYHFDQIANWSADEVAWVNANLEGFKGRVSRDNWVEQAKILAAGGETEFSKRVEDGDVY